jgi:protein-S-isoprenylcysteine O-methyltransferase Ste14
MAYSPGIDTAASPEIAAAPAERADADVPSIIAPGPWIAFGALALGIAFERLHKFGMLNQAPAWLRDMAAFVLIAYGGWLIWRANVIFHRAGTSFQPWRPTRTIAAVGVYSRTRNPMYQGFLVLVLGIAVLFRFDWAVLFMMPAAMLIHHGVVLREERYLERRFGESYLAYKSGVPRYGWPLFGGARKQSLRMI